MRNRLYQIAVFLTIVCCFFSSNFVFAASEISNLSIPASAGSIKDTFKAHTFGRNAERIIIHIQDAHCNYEAQKNLVQILDFLVKVWDLKLIMVEGGSGDVSLSFLRSYSDKKTRKETAEEYLRKGEISGEEYLDIVSDYNLELYGIEDEALYDANLNAFLNLESYRKEGLGDLEKLSSVVEKLKPYIYQQELKEFSAKKKSYEEKAVSLSEYCRYLNETADRKGLDLRGYSHFTAFVGSVRMEKEFDFKDAELQRSVFIKDLAKLMDKHALRELIDKTRKLKSGTVEPCEYYSFLKIQAKDKINLAKDYSLLNSYINYVVLNKDIDASELLEEISLLEEEVRNSLFAGKKERRLSEISKYIGIVNRFLKLELSPGEYEYFRAHKPNFFTSSWIDFLTENCRQYNIGMYPAASRVIDENLDKLDEFYQLGIVREEAFFDNMDKKMDESGEKIAVLITGGFHTPGITRMLKNKGYSYAVVVPVITKETDSSVYFSVLKGRKSRQAKTIGYGE